MKGEGIYWYDLQFSNYVYTIIINETKDGYEAYEYVIKSATIYVYHLIHDELEMEKIRNKVIIKREGFRDAFKMLFDKPTFNYIEFNTLHFNSDTKIIISRKK